MSARRRIAILVAGVIVLSLAIVLPDADADVFGNVGPASQLPSGALADAYPLGSYLLDHHFDAVKAGVLSGVDVSGIAPTIAWFLAHAIWQLTAFLANAVITLFTFAFSLDLVNGSSATGGEGALAPVAEAVRTIYRDVFGAAWLTVAVLVAGLWAIWTALVRRRYTETAGALAMSVVFVVMALAFVTQPERTIGTASRWTNQLSGAFLSLSANGTITDHDDAKREVSDQLFKTLIYDPWVVLNFGGLEHCVRDADSDDPTSVAVRPFSSNPARDAQLSRQLSRSEQVQAEGKVCVNNRLKYAPHFLRFAFGSDQRKAQYEALKAGDSGKLPDEDPGKRDGTYRLSAIDKPAAEAMGKSGQYERLGLAVVILIGELGAFMLLGSLSVAVILAQVLVLLLLAFAPVALVAGVVPKRGHEFFIGWLQRVGAFLIRKAVYSLVLAVVLAVAGALASAAGNLGWLMAFGLQAAFFWAVFLYRRQLTGQLSHAVTATTTTREESRATAGGLVALYAVSRLAKRAIRRDRADSSTAPPAPQAPPPQGPPASPPPSPTQPPPTSNEPADDRGGQEHHAHRADPRPAGSESRPRSASSSDEPTGRRAASAVGDRVELRASLRPVVRDAGSRGSEDDTRPSERAIGSVVNTPRSDSGAAAEPTPPRRDRPSSRSGSTARGDHAPDQRALEAAAPRGRPPQPAPAARTPGSSTAERGSSDSPLLASLRHDARRLHHDATRLHRDAQQLAEQDAASPSKPAAPPHPLPPPIRRTSPTETPKGGESA